MLSIRARALQPLPSDANIVAPLLSHNNALALCSWNPI
jgi:hypothetical protein